MVIHWRPSGGESGITVGTEGSICSGDVRGQCKPGSGDCGWPWCVMDRVLEQGSNVKDKSLGYYLFYFLAAAYFSLYEEHE